MKVFLEVTRLPQNRFEQFLGLAMRLTATRPQFDIPAAS
jgi:hypothetical protein